MTQLFVVVVVVNTLINVMFSNLKSVWPISKKNLK